MVIEDILLFVVTFTGIDERIVQIPVLIVQAKDSRAGMPGDIGYLVLVKRIAWVCYVAGVLVGLLGAEGCSNTAT